MSAGGTIDADEIERICFKLTRLADSVRKTQPTVDRRSALGLLSLDRTTLAGAIARRYLKRRRARDAVLPRELLGDPDWEMLLDRSEEHTSELQSLMRISYAVFCLKKKTR